MITKEALIEANKSVGRIEIGKDKKGNPKMYTSVAARIWAFREMCPDGLISTSILEHENGVVTMVATVKDENGKVLATGFAQEKENSSYINKTSYIENCETSAVGRALGFLGIGSDENMASAEEMVNAMTQQMASEMPDPNEVKSFKETLTPAQIDSIEKKFGKAMEELSRIELGEAMQKMREIHEKNKGKS